MYLHHRKDWPNFKWDADGVLPYVGKVRDLQGRPRGRMEGMNSELRKEWYLKP